MGYCIVISWKEGRQEGRKDDLRVQSFPLYLNLFWYPSAHARLVSPSTQAILIHVRCVLNSWQKKVHCNGCLHLPTVILLPWQFFLLNKTQFGALRVSQTRSLAPCSNWNTSTRPLDVLHRSWAMLMLDKKTIAVCPFAATLIPEPQAF